MNPEVIIAIVGGDARRPTRPFPPGVRVRRYGSRKDSGNGGLARLTGALKSGGIDGVVVMVRWMGHPGCNQIRATCKRLGVPCRLTSGGEASARLAVTAMAANDSGVSS